MHLAIAPPPDVYARVMDERDPHIVLRFENGAPVELADFVGLFVGLGNQFEKFTGTDHLSDQGTARFLVQEVRSGSILATLLPAILVPPLIGGSLAAIKNVNDVVKFVENLNNTVGKYFKRGGRDEAASKGDLTDFYKTVSGCANDPDSNLSIAAYEDGQKKAVFKFTSKQARIAAENIVEHRAELERTTAADYERVLLRFVRPSAEAGKPGRKGGERAIIDKISRTARPVLYASDLASQRMKHELLEAEGNVFRLLFDVDVNVEQSATGKPLAYRITAVHDVIDGGEEPSLV